MSKFNQLISSFTIVLFLICSSIKETKADNSSHQSVVDSTMIRTIYDQALVNGEAYDNLRVLCKSVGHRLSGSPAADKAVVWGEQVLKKMGLDTVYLQEIKVPHWDRGNLEQAWINSGKPRELRIATLGGSVASKGKITAGVIEVQSLEEVKNLDPQKVKGKFVFYNRPMDARKISTFDAYGGCVDQRYWGAVEAAAAGAIGVFVRSMTTLESDHFPHTGSMGYSDTVTKIPAVALATEDANYIHDQLLKNPSITLSMNINPTWNPDKKSYNVIGELRGSEFPDKIMVVGGHLDSWDLGEGAHDDGAGIVHSMEALRLLKAAGYRPRHTIRVVLFMNEENGNMGGKSYASIAHDLREDHVVAIESDRGGFTPRGFSLVGNETQLKMIQSFRELLEPYGLHFFEFGYGGVDIGPLAQPLNKIDADLMLLGLVPDSQRYFDFHHTADDVFENVNKRELELGCASMASMLYLLDKTLHPIK
ncbi:MAG: M20/M25/M40 family metallo-hydrolase [Flavobacteriales bacterium]|nr:M20/M25/M40 family metallo-hydrolase [Bacteroidota bacterium]MCB9241105.1 M20/M25/M40 family metallo-hydrolase [Flavobacteriales bacterium]